MYLCWVRAIRTLHHPDFVMLAFVEKIHRVAPYKSTRVSSPGPGRGAGFRAKGIINFNETKIVLIGRGKSVLWETPNKFSTQS